MWRTMHRTISNDLAKSINWRGVNGKISLAALKIKDVVIGKEIIDISNSIYKC